MSNNTFSRYLTPKDFEQAFGEKINPYVSGRIKDYRFRYRLFKQEERDSWLRQIIDVLIYKSAVPAGRRRRAAWDAGWGENVARFNQKAVFRSLIPGYFGKYPVVRWLQDFICPLNSRFEYHSLAVIQDWLFDLYLRDAETVYEFGCGTGHNLFRVRSVNPNATLYGLDWSTSSQLLLSNIHDSGLDTRIAGRRFDMFHPDRRIRLEPGACIYTVASLEQLGEQFAPFLDFLLNQPVQLCIHIEPIGELLDPNNLLDNLSLEYFKMRNYLSGFLNHLRRLETKGYVKIHRAQRTFIGSLFIEGYSAVVWSPCRATKRGRRLTCTS